MTFLHSSTIRARNAAVVAFAVLLTIPASLSAQTVTAPSGVVAVPTSGDFFSSAFQDPIDMRQLTDIGWVADGLDQPRANLSGISIGNRMLSATASSNHPNMFLLDTGNPLRVPLGRRR